MNIVYAHSLFKNAASPADEDGRLARFLKAIKSSKIFLTEENQRNSEMNADGNTTRMNRAFRWRKPKKNDDAGFAALGGDTAVAIMLSSNPINWQAVKEGLQLLFPAIFIHQYSGRHAEHNFLNNSFRTSVEYVSDDFAQSFKKHMRGEKFAAKSTAASIANKAFVGPLRPEMQNLTADFMKKNISQEVFEERATKTLLKYQEIQYSKEHDSYIIGAGKLANIRNAFEAQGKNSLGSTPIITFREAAESYTLEEAQPVLQPAPQLVYARALPAPTLA